MQRYHQNVLHLQKWKKKHIPQQAFCANQKKSENYDDKNDNGDKNHVVIQWNMLNNPTL
jgi:hypothetical protein